MQQIRVLIGPFPRRVFAAGLVILLRDTPDFDVRQIEDEALAAGLMDSVSPVFVILETRGDADSCALQPKSGAVTVILVSVDEPDILIALR